jgi:hypothetical protein
LGTTKELSFDETPEEEASKPEDGKANPVAMET